jgi:hypothetical protein
LKGIRAIVHLSDGSRRTLVMDAFSILYRRPGAGTYGGCKDWTQGVWLGALKVEGETMALDERGVHDALHFTDDFALRIICDGEQGWGVSEPLIPGIGELVVT